MIDESKLVSMALDARNRAYAPYSNYKVGAAICGNDGNIVIGANVENASFGLTICAERTAVFGAVLGGVSSIVAVAVATEDGGSPCGACRQVLMEFAPDDPSAMLIILVDKLGVIQSRTTLEELLPNAFRLK